LPMTDVDAKASKRDILKGRKFIVAIVLTITFLAVATYAIMSDTSVRGLTVKMYSVSRYCASTSGTGKTLNFNIQGKLWSASSLQTTVSHGVLTLSVDGSSVGTAPQADKSFSAGQSVPFNVNFTQQSLNPTNLPLQSRLVLTLSATVAAGLYSVSETSADDLVQNFGTSTC